MGVPIRQALIYKLGKNYPSSMEMLKKFEEVVTQLNLLDSSNPSENSANKPNVMTSNANSNDVTTFNVNHSKTTLHKCLFCDKAHYFWKCDSIVDDKARLNILNTKYPKNCKKYGFFHP